MTGLGDVVGRAGMSLFPQIALVMFFVVFVGIVAYVVLRRKGAWDRAKRLPLDDEPPAKAEDERG